MKSNTYMFAIAALTMGIAACGASASETPSDDAATESGVADSELRRCDAHESLRLTEEDASRFAPAIEAFNQAQPVGGWNTISSLRVFSYPDCVKPYPTSGRVTELLMKDTRAIEGFRDGTGSGLMLKSRLLSHSYFRHGGDDLLSALSTDFGSTLVFARSWTEEGRCHNCTEFIESSAIVFPLAHKVVLVQGVWGWDS